MRYTAKYAKKTMFPIWLNLVKGREATSYNDVGAYQMDYAACYGGVGVQRISSSNGGVRTIVGRMTPREFAYFVWNMESSLRSNENV